MSSSGNIDFWKTGMGRSVPHFHSAGAGAMIDLSDDSVSVPHQPPSSGTLSIRLQISRHVSMSVRAWFQTFFHGGVPPGCLAAAWCDHLSSPDDDPHRLGEHCSDTRTISKP
jgi:hypothetical protein